MEILKELNNQIPDIYNIFSPENLNKEIARNSFKNELDMSTQL